MCCVGLVGIMMAAAPEADEQPCVRRNQKNAECYHISSLNILRITDELCQYRYSGITRTHTHTPIIITYTHTCLNTLISEQKHRYTRTQELSEPPTMLISVWHTTTGYLRRGISVFQHSKRSARWAPWISLTGIRNSINLSG